MYNRLVYPPSLQSYNGLTIITPAPVLSILKDRDGGWEGSLVKEHYLHHKKVEGICIVHQMKDVNVLCLLTYFILRKSEKVKNCI